jgi:hypothetical protein
MGKDNEQLKICKNCKRMLNCNDAQMNYFYSCDLWIGDNEQKPSITITEDNSETIQLEFDFSKDYNNEKE